MPMCPICNQLHTVTVRCPDCGNEVQDQGRIHDYYDNYSPYMEIDGLKLEDGFKQDFADSQCPHVFYCTACHQDVLFFISEWP